MRWKEPTAGHRHRMAGVPQSGLRGDARLLKTPVIFDGRNLYDLKTVAGHGFTYYSIGRETNSPPPTGRTTSPSSPHAEARGEGPCVTEAAPHPRPLPQCGERGANITIKEPLMPRCLAIILLLFTAPLFAETYLYIADHKTGKVIKIKADGTLVWDAPNGNGHDVQVLPNKNILHHPRQRRRGSRAGQEGRLEGRQADRALPPNRCSGWPTATPSSPTMAA